MLEIEESSSDYNYFCYSCDTEFAVVPAFELGEQVSFCPYCGSEVEEPVDEDLDDMEEEDLDEDEDIEDE